jgi:hypothetical protein
MDGMNSALRLELRGGNSVDVDYVAGAHSVAGAWVHVNPSTCCQNTWLAGVPSCVSHRAMFPDDMRVGCDLLHMGLGMPSG